MYFIRYYLKSIFWSFSLYIVGLETGASEIDQTVKDADTSTFEENTADLSHLSPENRKKYEDISDQIDGMKKKYEAILATKRISRDVAESLLKKFSAYPDMKDDPDARQTIDMFLHYKKQYKEALKQEGDISGRISILTQNLSNLENGIEQVEFSAGIDYNEKTGEVTDTKFTQESLQTIENKDILSLPKNERLQYITKGNIDSNRVASGEVKDVEFTFTFDGKYNRELYLSTTAGQTLPEEVGSVISNGKEYMRSGLTGEFFNGNNRFVIRENTHMEVAQLRSEKKLASIRSGFDTKVDHIKDPIQKMITLEALKRDMVPEMVLETFSSILGKLSEGERQGKLEDLFTQLERVRGDYGIDKNDKKAFKDVLVDDGSGNLGGFNRVNGKVDFENLELREGVKGLLDLISVFESGGNYNAIWGNGRQSKIDFTNMSIREVLAHQDKFVASGKASSAIGRYQFIRKTLRACVSATGLSMDAKFNEENQDKLGVYLLKQRGLDSFMAGKMSVAQFQLNLSKEWASLPKDSSGKSYYHGDGLNNAGISSQKLRSHLASMRV